MSKAKTLETAIKKTKESCKPRTHKIPQAIKANSGISRRI